MRGTPLKKFGNYQVFQVKGGRHPFWVVWDLKRDRQTCISEVKESAYFAADKLAQGSPLQTPRELLEESVLGYPSIFPSRFYFYDHTYIVLGNGVSWIQGGLSHEDVTGLTPEGRAFKAKKLEAIQPDRIRNYEETDPEGWREMFGFTSKDVRDSFLNGTWPDVLPPRESKGDFSFRHSRNHLYPITEDYTRYVPLGELAASTPVEGAREEWVGDARNASRILLQYGVDPPKDREDTSTPGPSSRLVLEKWAGILTERYGGVWTP